MPTTSVIVAQSDAAVTSPRPIQKAIRSACVPMPSTIAVPRMKTTVSARPTAPAKSGV